MKKRINPYKTLAGFIFIIVILLFVYSLINYSVLEDKISNSVKTYGVIPIFIFAFLFDFFPQYISPHILMVTANFFDMNMFWVIFLVVIGSIAGSMSGFELGNKLKKSTLLVSFLGKDKTKKLEQEINKKGKYLISLAAVSPFPYVPLIIGMLHMKRKNFIIYGILPRTLGLIIIGLLTYGVFI